MLKLLRKITWTLVVLVSLITSNSARAEETVKPEKTPIENAEEWVYNFIATNAKPGRKLWYHNAQETEEEAIARYHSIAKDVVAVVWAPSFRPVFKDPENGRSKTAVIILGIMLHESGFRKDVDLNLGKHSRGDNGQSWCMMQLMIGKGKTWKWNFVEDRVPQPGDNPDHLFTGYTGDELIADRQKCISEGYKVVRSSFGACGRLPLTEKLTSYASGVCSPSDDPKLQAKFEAGKEKSKIRMGSALRWYEKTKDQRNFKDFEVVAAFSS